MQGARRLLHQVLRVVPQRAVVVPGTASQSPVGGGGVVGADALQGVQPCVAADQARQPGRQRLLQGSVQGLVAVAHELLLLLSRLRTAS